VQFLKEGKSSKDFIEILDTETTRLTQLVQDFLMFSRPSDAPREEVDLSDMVRIIIERNRTSKTISADIEEGVSIVANRMFIEVALTNIVKNAREAADSNVFVALKRKTDYSSIGTHGVVVMEVEDDGNGIDESIKDRIFEPFFTTKQNGTGLGLAIAYRVIHGFGGYIVAGKSSHGGAKFTIVMPSENGKKIKEGR
jgi:two-component system sensor histidine kinase PilS (NtrC family)